MQHRPPTPSPEVIVASPGRLADEFARRVARRAQNAVRAHGRFAMAIPGGSVARAFLPVLGTAAIPWESTALFWVDERAVPPDDPESNVGMARLLLAGSPVAALAEWHPMEATQDLEGSARIHGDQLQRVLGDPPRFDLILLGVGDDGHIASLFPGHQAPSGKWVAAVHDSPKPPRRRLSLTYETFAAAGQICVAALGTGKAGIVRTMLGTDAPDLPIVRVLSKAVDVVVFIDEGAASLME